MSHFLIITLSILFKDGFLSITCFFSCCAILTKAENRILLFQHALHYIPRIVLAGHSCDTVSSKKARKLMWQNISVFKSRLMGFHRIMLFRVFLHEILQNSLTIFSVTIDAKATKTTPTVSAYHLSLSLSSGFVPAPISNQLNPMLGLHFYFCILPNSCLITWTCFTV